MAFDAAIFNTLKDIRERQDQLIAEQRTTNQWLARVAQLLEAQNQPNVMSSGPWPPVQR